MMRRTEQERRAIIASIADSMFTPTAAPVPWTEHEPAARDVIACARDHFRIDATEAEAQAALAAARRGT